MALITRKPQDVERWNRQVRTVKGLLEREDPGLLDTAKTNENMRWQEMRDAARPGSVNAPGGLMQPEEVQARMPWYQKMQIGSMGMPEPMGTVAGLFGDAGMFLEDPSSRTWPNALGAFANVALPFMGGMTVWHGSPHKFSPHKTNKLGRFDSSKIGTGEGAQAYGHGIYVAEKKGTARIYQENLRPLTEVEDLRIGGVPIVTRGKYADYSPHQFTDTPTAKDFARANLQESIMIDEWKLKEAFDTGGEEAVKGIVLENIDSNISMYKDDWPEIVPEYERIRKRITSGIGNKTQFKKGTSHLYEVDLPDEHINKMLDWDAPLSEQPENVKKILEPLNDLPQTLEPGQGAGQMGWQLYDKETGYLDAAHGTFTSEADALEYLNNPTGAELYQGLVDKAAAGGYGKNMTERGQAEASEALKQLGIPGIKYYDAGSRTAGEGTRNFVVFDDSLMKILKRE